MQKDFDLRLLPKQASDIESIKHIITSETGIPFKDITSLRILRRSIDARQHTIYINVKVRVFVNEIPAQQAYSPINYPNVSKSPQAIIVGAGPAGLFAALRLIELGVKPIVVERGKNVRTRKIDTALLNREHIVNPESNYCFGEGGAGAYSDGKLYTRSKKRGNVEKILTVFCQHGADPSILIDAHPHIGTDKLPAIIEKMRNQIIDSGGEVYFETRMDELIIENKEIKGIKTNTGNEFIGKVILASSFG